ncbi:MAG: ribbon-helix-helix protein, CopG family [Nitrospinae bacterium]|nr:ribbon-helix-helix protein, CopG family [Nitrospinota bacterium]
MPGSTTMTVRMTADARRRLERMAKATNRSKSFLAAAAIEDYLALNEWQIREIKAGVREADAGDFATERQVRATLKKWGVNARR